jgi:hypothetical protein
MSNTTLDPVAEIAALQKRQATSKLAAEQDAKETQARLAALFELQAPIHTLLQQRYDLRRRMARCEKFHVGFSADAVAARQTWHAECQSLARDNRNALHGVCAAMFTAEACKAESGKSLALLRDDLAELEGQILKAAKESHLEGILPKAFPQDPLDE